MPLEVYWRKILSIFWRECEAGNGEAGEIQSLNKMELSERRGFCSLRCLGCLFKLYHSFSVERLSFQVFNCSQTKFLAIILVLSVFFMRFFA